MSTYWVEWQGGCPESDGSLANFYGSGKFDSAHSAGRPLHVEKELIDWGLVSSSRVIEITWLQPAGFFCATIMMLPPSFSDRFCARFKHHPSDFDRAIFSLLFYPVWVPLARILCYFCPSMFKIDFEIIHQVGGARSLREVVAEAENLVFRYSSTWIRQLLRFRISGKRVISMGEILFEEERPPRKSPV